MKSIDYLIYKDVHETFISKIMFKFGSKNEKICVNKLYLVSDIFWTCHHKVKWLSNLFFKKLNEKWVTTQIFNDLKDQLDKKKGKKKRLICY